MTRKPRPLPSPNEGRKHPHRKELREQIVELFERDLMPLMQELMVKRSMLYLDELYVAILDDAPTREFETERRKKAVELLIRLGYRWTGTEWIQKP